jgi:hypothetical protein
MVSKDPGWMTGWIPQSAWPNLLQARAETSDALEGPDQWDEDFLLSLCVTVWFPNAMGCECSWF